MTKDEAFDLFWKTYPRRIAKAHARKAFDKAIKKTTIEVMLKAIADYIRFKPERIDFKHPSTWLNGGCWDDEWQSVPAVIQQRRPSMADLTHDLFSGAGYERIDH